MKILLTLFVLLFSSSVFGEKKEIKITDLSNIKNEIVKEIDTKGNILGEDIFAGYADNNLILNPILYTYTFDNKLEYSCGKKNSELRVDYVIHEPLIKIHEYELAKADVLNGYKWIVEFSIHSDTVKIIYDIAYQR